MLGIMAEARPAAGKHHRGGGGKHRGSRRLGAAAPLAGAALCGALLLFLLSRIGGGGGSEEAEPLGAYSGDAGSLPGADGGGGGRAAWLSAAGLWAEEHMQHVRARLGLSAWKVACMRRAAGLAFHVRLALSCQPPAAAWRVACRPPLPALPPTPAAPARQGQPLPAARRLRRAALLLAAPAPPAYAGAVCLHRG